ncbi:small ribosomal subunit protein mS37 [Tachypleus tridentatus]|uniref:small ribosomal subunit protein mS37 n=1 Tax=Tachypleus tridentatus TaxID=6853 RepID=UPI003FD1B507
MTRLTAPLLRKPGRRPAVPPFKFQEILPLALKNRVSGKSGADSEVCCLSEMMTMLSCFRNHDFDQSNCGKEMQAFQTCYVSHLKNLQIKRKKESLGLIPGLNYTEMSSTQVNRLLKTYPLLK